MANTVTPHFDLPFRFLGNGTTAVAEQDSYEDVCNCIEAIVRTPLGFRLDALDFGFPSLEFVEQPILTSDVIELVSSQEPRANLIMTETPDFLDILIDRITVEVGAA